MKLEKKVRTIIVLIIIMVILLIGTNILKYLRNKDNNIWDYKKITSAADVLYYGEEINNRIIYWQLKDIITGFVSTMEENEVNSQIRNSEKSNYLEYYEILTHSYKKHLNKKEFNMVSQKFINKFLLEDHLGYKYVGKFIIEKIYKFRENQYLCVIKNIEVNAVNGYIGIELDENKSKFKIFYIE